MPRNRQGISDSTLMWTAKAPQRRRQRRTMLVGVAFLLANLIVLATFHQWAPYVTALIFSPTP